MGLRRQKAAVGGRSPTESEVSGIVSGYASAAEERLYDAKALALTESMHKEDLEQQKKEFEESSATEKEQFAEELAFQKEKFEKSYALQKETAEEEASQFAKELAQRKYEYQTSYESELDMFERELEESTRRHDAEMELAWSEYGQSSEQFYAQLKQDANQFEQQMAASRIEFGEEMKFQKWYAEEQIRIAEEANDGISWLCTETNKQIGLSLYMAQAINKFRDYVWKNHKRIFVYYLRNGHEIVDSINKKAKDKAKEVFRDFRDSILEPIMHVTNPYQMEDAFQLYKEKSFKLVKEYLPSMVKKGQDLIAKDDARFLNSAA